MRAQGITINFPVGTQQSSVVRVMALKLQELVAKEIGADALQVNVVDRKKDLFEEMIIGNAQMIAPKLSRFKRYLKRIQVFELPYMFYSGKAAEDF